MDTRTITLVLCFLFLGLMAQAQRTEVRLKRVEQAPRPGAIILAEADSLAAWNDTLYWDGTVLWLDSARTITLPYLQDSILSGYADTTYAQSLVISTSLTQDSILTYTQDNAEIGRDTVRITWGNIQGIPAGIADGDDDTQLTPAQVVGVARDTGFVERSELADTSSVLRTYTDEAEADAKAYADANDDVDDDDADPTNELQNWSNLPGIPADIADGDDNTQLTPSQVVGIARDTGFVERSELADTSSVLRTYTDQAEADAKAYADANDDVDDADADPTNELQNWGNLPGIPADIADGDDNTQITPAQVVGIARDTGFVDRQELSDSIIWKENAFGETYYLNSVGIGTSDPEATLHIRGDGNPGFRFESNWATGIPYFELLNPSYGYEFRLLGISGNMGIFDPNRSAYPFLIESSGDVGIGSTAPAERLHVDGGNIRMVDGSEAAGSVVISDANGTMSHTTTPESSAAFSGWDTDASDDFSGSWNDLSNIPTDIADGDDNTQLTPAQVVGIARDTGFLESIIAGYGLKDAGTTGPELELDFSELGDSPTADGDADIILYLPTGDVGAKTDLQNALNNTLTSSDSSVTITEVGANQIDLQAAGGSGSNDWNDLINVPAGFADDIDNVSVETWSTLSGIPAGFADGIDDVGAGAEGTLYASITGNNDAVVSMASYTDSADVRWHFANDTLLLNTWYMGLDGSDNKAFKWAWNSNDFSSPALNIETNGNIGVGTTTPVEKLHVDGGNIRMATASAGSNRIIYDSDGQGTMEWTTASALGIDDTNLSLEEVQDMVGAMVSGNTETGIDVTYDDLLGNLDFVVSGGGGTGDIEGVTAGTGLGGGGTSGTVSLETAFDELPLVGTVSGTDYFVMRTARDENSQLNDTDARVDAQALLLSVFNEGQEIDISSTNSGQTIDFDVDFSEATLRTTIDNNDEVIFSRFSGDGGNARIDADDLAVELQDMTQEFTQAFASADVSYSTFFSNNPNCREWFLTVTNNASSGGVDVTVTIPSPSSTHRGKKIYVIGNSNANGGQVDITAGTSNIHGLQGAALSEWTKFVVFGPVILTCMYDPDSSGNYIWMATDTGG